MMMKFMLDTNIVIYTMKNKPAEVQKSLQDVSHSVCLSSVTVMELVYGVEKSSRVQENMHTLEEFLARLYTAPYDTSAAFHTGQLRCELRSQPIGAYDMMIAGHARSLGLILVTNNTQEFERVPGLRLQNWVHSTNT